MTLNRRVFVNVDSIPDDMEESTGKRPSVQRERERLRALIARYGEVKAIMEYFRCESEALDRLPLWSDWTTECGDSIGRCVGSYCANGDICRLPLGA